MLIKHRLFFVVLALLPFLSQAQVDTQEQNPYSAFGIGELRTLEPVRNMGMGGVGLATPSKEYINFQNPALLSRTQVIRHRVQADESVATIAKAYNVSEEELRQLNGISLEVNEGQLIRIPVRKYTMWSAAMRGGYRNVVNPQEDYNNAFLGFQHFAFSVPISQRISSAIGIAPYSAVGFEREKVFEDFNDTTTQRTIDQLGGGLYQAYISGGFDISPNISAGLQTGFLFGQIEQNHITQNKYLGDDYFGIQYVSATETSYSGLVLKPGLFYTTKITSGGRDSALYLNVGATYTHVANAFAGQTVADQVRGVENELIRDSVTQERTGYVTLPDEFGLGFSIRGQDRWMLGADFTYSTWSDHSIFDSEEDQGNVYDLESFSYTDSYKISVGGEVKRLGNRDRVSMKSPTYRAGLSYQKLPYVINGENIYNYSASLGATFPVGRINAADKQQPLTKINLSLTAGLQGDRELSPGREFYIKAHAGILISDRWFRRRKIQ